MKKRFVLLTLFVTTTLTIQTARKPHKSKNSTRILRQAQDERSEAGTQRLLLSEQSESKGLNEQRRGVKRTITLSNNIEPKMTVKKHWTGKYTPDPFAIMVDGKKLEPGKTAQVTIEDNNLNVQYSYSFANGYRKGTNQVTFHVPEQQDTLGMTFSWDNKNRVIILQARAIEKKEL